MVSGDHPRSCLEVINEVIHIVGYWPKKIHIVGYSVKITVNYNLENFFLFRNERMVCSGLLAQKNVHDP